MMTRNAVSSILLAVALGAFSASTFADDGCVDFKWDVGQERALFAGTATPLSAGMDLKSAPSVLLNHFYALQSACERQLSSRHRHAVLDRCGVVRCLGRREGFSRPARLQRAA